MSDEPTAYEQLLKAVIAEPYDDAPRLAFAEHFRSRDPDHATLIEQQVESACQRRRKQKGLPESKPQSKDNDRNLRALTAAAKAGRFTPGSTLIKYTRSFEYDRGFITAITIEPYTFLEYGEWLYANAPVTQVAFSRAEEGDFPMKELANSPLLAKLDSLDFDNCALTDQLVLELTKSPYLRRLLSLNLSSNDRIGPASYEALAAAPETRKLLDVTRRGADVGEFPGEKIEDSGQIYLSGATIYDWSEMTAQGRALERKYGYIPWLNARANSCSPFDSSWCVAEGLRPARPAGSPPASRG